MALGNVYYDIAGNRGASTSATFTVDTSAPTVNGAAYYSDAGTSSPLSGTVKSGNDIYTKVTFIETVGHTASDGARARPEINYTVGSTQTQYDIVANNATLASGDCKPRGAPPANVYVCYYRVGGSDIGVLGFEVDTGTADRAGNALASAWRPSTTLTLEPAPVFSTSIVDQDYTVDTPIDALTLPAATGGDEITTLTYSLSPALPAGLTFDAGARSITGTPSAVAAETEYTYTVTEGDGDSAVLNFKITVSTFQPDPGSLNTANAILTISDNTLTVSEGASGTFTVVLDGAPGGPMSVALSSNNADVTLSHDVLDFTTGNWHVPQTVTVSAAHDDDARDDTAAIALDPLGTDYDGLINATVIVRVTDDDKQAPDDHHALTLSENTLTVSEGTSGTFTVVLDGAPGGPMSVALSSNNADVTLSHDVLDFTTGNWHVPQTVTVSAAHDDDARDDTAVITLDPSGIGYDEVASATVAVTVTDDDESALKLSANALTVAEGASGTFTVVLDGAPAGPVSVALSGDNADVTLSQDTLSFTTGELERAADRDRDRSRTTTTRVTTPRSSPSIRRVSATTKWPARRWP